MSIEGLTDRLACCVPQAHGFVITTTDNQFAIWAKGYCIDRFFMSIEGLADGLACCVPQSHDFVITTTDNQFAI